MAPASGFADGPSLLLLPGLSFPLTRSNLWAAYSETFDNLFPRLSRPSSTQIHRLDIAVSLSESSLSQHRSTRSGQYEEIQFLVQEMYTLVCACAARTKTELDYPGGVDARIFMIDETYPGHSTQSAGNLSFAGPIVDLCTFVAARRQYTIIFAADGPRSEDLLQQVLCRMKDRALAAPKVERLPSGPAVATKDAVTSNFTKPVGGLRHRSVAVGGTFDHLHLGHKLLLTATVFMAEPQDADSAVIQRTITIGITGDELLVNKKHASLVESWDDRQKSTDDFVESILVFHPDISSVRRTDQIDNPGPNGKIVRVSYGESLVVNYTRISDPFGPTITDPGISALIISAETRAGGKGVNDKRIEKGWKELEVFEVGVLDATAAAPNKSETKEETVGRTPTTTADDFTNKISSTEIRRRLEAAATPTNPTKL